MRYAYSVARVRDLEREAMVRVGDGALMQRAAHGLAVAIAGELERRRGLAYGARVLVVVGPGNNGGDALFAGQRLARRGCSVLAVRALGSPHPAGWAALQSAGGRMVDLAHLGEAALGRTDLAVDGLLGIGGRAGLPPECADLVGRLAAGGVPIVAVDQPSGVAADTGSVPEEAVRASRTVTFGTLKPCHVLEPARTACGALELVDIGLDTAGTAPALSAWEPSDVASAWPVPGPSSDKYARGVVGIDTGSPDYPGAAVLSTYGAVYGGAGMVRFAGPDRAAEAVGSQLPNVVFADGRVQSVLLGSGWGERADGGDVVARRVGEGLPLVIDADGLRFLPEDLDATRTLLTPHAGELARLLGVERAEVTGDPVGAVRSAADRTGATVLLKGATQLVAIPGQPSVQVAVPGPAWTGQAGSGDVLGGLCAALLAAGLEPFRAGVVGASIQAMAAADLPGPVPPQELARHCARLVGRLTSSRGTR